MGDRAGGAAWARWPGAPGSMVLCNPLLLPPIVLDVVAACWRLTPGCTQVAFVWFLWTLPPREWQ